ncbi:MAG: pyruvate dehydrogenase complex E1 component subunit beta [Holosporales bacterium]|jgi:pyruvate dehydrogenase E1 component beta subunit|nr:pyruvate dehydrogenase complex E1 component subunit beta [Holosporales bacterium]
MRVSVRNALREAMVEEMRLDRKVFLIGEEVGRYEGAYKVSKDMEREFGATRVIDTPITEHGFTGLGVGAALAGLRPIVEFMTFNFAMQAMDHIINSAAKIRFMSGGLLSCPIVFRGPNGIPRNVAAQHSQCFASWFAHVPGLRVVAPYTSEQAKCLLKAAIRIDDPVIFLEHELLYSREFPFNKKLELMPLDKAIIMREGTDITLTAFSISLDHAIKVADILQEKHGISAEIINLISLSPIDKSTIIESVKKTGRIMNIEEGWSVCGVGSEIISIVTANAFDYLDAEPTRICSFDAPIPYAKNLEEAALPKIADVVRAAVLLCKGKRKQEV